MHSCSGLEADYAPALLRIYIEGRLHLLAGVCAHTAHRRRSSATLACVPALEIAAIVRSCGLTSGVRPSALRIAGASVAGSERCCS